MKNVARTATLVLGLSLLLSGCGVGTTEPEDTPDDVPETPAPKTANLTVNWSFKKADGTADVCPATFNKVQVWAQPYSNSGDNYYTTGSPIPNALLDCAGGKLTARLQTSGDIQYANGSIADRVNGTYDIWLVLTEGSGEIEHIKTFTQRVDLASGDKSLNFAFYPNAGFRYLNWGPKAKSTGDLISCAAGAVDTIKVRSKLTHTPDYTPVAGGKETVDTFPCTGVPGVFVMTFGARGGGYSSPLEAGYYSITVEAYSNGTLVGTAEENTDELVEDRGRYNAVADGYLIPINTR